MPDPFIPTRQEDFLSPAEVAHVSGLDLMKGVMAGRYPAAPIARLVNLVMTDAAEGTVTFEATPDIAHYNPQGTVHGGWFGVALDSAMACAVMTTLPAGRSYTTLEYKVNVLRPAFAHTGTLQVIGRAIHSGRRTATAEGRIEDASGKLYATGTTTCMVFAMDGA